MKRTRTEQLLQHINNIDEYICYTIERESNNQLPFLDVNVEIEGERLRTAVFRKTTCTNQVLNFESNHSRFAKSAVVRSLIDRIDTHLENEHIEERTTERYNVMEPLMLNGYPKGFVRQVQERKRRAQRDPPAQKEKPTERRWLSVPFTQGLSESIARILRPLGIDVAHRAAPWKWRVCSGIKDKIPTSKRKGVVYSIECDDCSAV